MKSFFTIILFCFSFTCLAQNITSKEILQNTIKYQDPNGNWQNFNETFTVVMTTPKSSNRKSVITINLPKEKFKVTATKDSITTTYSLDKSQCQLQYNGKVLDSVSAKTKKMSCGRAFLYKNYYTYLYGLPMKLKDSGTNLSDKVEKKTFKGKEYLVLKVTYDEAVGSDVWYFYINPETYALEVYQFFKTDDNGEIKPESGEYILLSEEVIINDIKIPKVRAWYYNKDDKYLGTDTLIED
ncbi:DUF6503 family protein [Winogradskyella endarachnes]|uniref:Aspartyl-tRNA synthetase n=1 Tax=Winogradskyella endarachnes TaxID=2681965 RepID=A0A6L6UEU5_9FLAO|nr:DUF6503 family protein [Winogradskyella endarachnes]MUU79334.1 hypothetical protein [Winogradskyella endarachnes]